MIGIVGGIGPYAGIDLLKKVFDNTLADSDQDYLDTVLLSLPSGIKDRTEYLLGKIEINPAYAIAEVLIKLQQTGVTVAGIPCNTAHVENIFNIIQQELKKRGSHIKILNMIDETVVFLANQYPKITKVGVLTTSGTYKSGIYSRKLQSKGYEVIAPFKEMQENLIHPAIYHPKYGIKACTNPIHAQAKENLIQGISFLKEQGAQAVILGCTEIPLAITEPIIDEMIMIDPTNVLARALIYEQDHQKLRTI